jgi:hypothetical protein
VGLRATGPSGRCTGHDSGHTIGVEFSEEANRAFPSPLKAATDYYEFLRVSKAEFATIQPVYRFLASRYRPDNAVTGDAEKFLLPEHAFEVSPDLAR